MEVTSLNNEIWLLQQPQSTSILGEKSPGTTSGKQATICTTFFAPCTGSTTWTRNKNRVSLLINSAAAKRNCMLSSSRRRSLCNTNKALCKLGTRTTGLLAMTSAFKDAYRRNTSTCSSVQGDILRALLHFCHRYCNKITSFSVFAIAIYARLLRVYFAINQATNVVGGFGFFGSP